MLPVGGAHHRPHRGQVVRSGRRHDEPAEPAGHVRAPGVQAGHQFLTGVAALGERHGAVDQPGLGGDGRPGQLPAGTGDPRLDADGLPGRLGDLEDVAVHRRLRPQQVEPRRPRPGDGEPQHVGTVGHRHVPGRRPPQGQTGPPEWLEFHPGAQTEPLETGQHHRPGTGLAVHDEPVGSGPGHADQGVQAPLGTEQQGLERGPLGQGLDVVAALALEVGHGVGPGRGQDVPPGPEGPDPQAQGVVVGVTGGGGHRPRRPSLRIPVRPGGAGAVRIGPGPTGRGPGAGGPQSQPAARRAMATAASMAAALWAHSSFSESGSESATIPAPACTEARPSGLTVMVRMAMAVSRFPEKSR